MLYIYNSVEDMFLWNPSSRRHRKLPFSPIESLDGYEKCRSINFRLGYDPTSDDYKLVRIAQFSGDVFKSYSNSEVKVYSPRSNSWRMIRYMTKPFILSCTRRLGVLANYALHWVAIRQTRPGFYSSFIISIDLEDEEYRDVPLLDSLVTRLVNVGVCGEQLCVFCHYVMDRVEVWVMKDYGMRDSSVKELSIKAVIGSFDDITLECYSKNGEVILQIEFKALFLYDPSGGSARSLRIHGASNMIETKICIGSLVLLDAKDGAEQAKTKKKNRK